MKTISLIAYDNQPLEITALDKKVSALWAGTGDEARANLLAALGLDGRGAGRNWKSAVARAALARGLPLLRADLEREGLRALIV